MKNYSFAYFLYGTDTSSLIFQTLYIYDSCQAYTKQVINVSHANWCQIKAIRCKMFYNIHAIEEKISLAAN